MLQNSGRCHQTKFVVFILHIVYSCIYACKIYIKKKKLELLFAYLQKDYTRIYSYNDVISGSSIQNSPAIKCSWLFIQNVSKAVVKFFNSKIHKTQNKLKKNESSTLSIGISITFFFILLSNYMTMSIRWQRLFCMNQLIGSLFMNATKNR